MDRCNYNRERRLLTFIQFFGGVILFFFIGCQGSTTSQVKSWAGGKITQPGKYALPHNALLIDVYLENNFVRYKVMDKSNRIVIHYNGDINTYQNWAFYLDTQKNFWVLGSDIGHSVWRRNKSGQFTQFTFNHVVTKSEVPESLYVDCKEFFYGHDD
jgi:hypothetical protein